MRELGDWRLGHDPRLPCFEAHAGDVAVTVLGHLIDTAQWEQPEVAVERAAAALQSGERGFLDAVDYWAGRHLIVWRRGGRMSAATDATGMRTCFFNVEGELILASHASLLARLTGASRSRREFERHRMWNLPRVRYFPGRTTPWSGIVFLTANSALDLETRELRRIWPRGPLPQLEMEEATRALAEPLRGQMRWIVDRGRNPVVASLTAGIDSRTTLAATRVVANRVTLFTYRSPTVPSHDDDMEIASRIAADLGLEHVRLEIPPDLGRAGTTSERALRRSCFLPHFRSGAEMYRRTFPPNAIHVRSNVAEIGRRFYDKKGTGVRIENAADMAAVWRRMGDVDECVDAFDEWAGATSFWEVSDVDPLDLFYWEHRMPCWHGAVALESDIAFDTHSLFNCRRVLETLLSVPTEARRQGALFTSFIDSAWPELADFPYA